MSNGLRSYGIPDIAYRKARSLTPSRGSTTVSGVSNVSAVACPGGPVSRCFDRARAAIKINQTKTLSTSFISKYREIKQREARPPGDATRLTLLSPDTVVEHL